jgi:hypothetical protein
MVQQGASRTAAQALVDTLVKTPPAITTTVTQPGMAQAIVDAMGLKDKIVAVPDNKSVIVSALTDAAKQQLTDLGLTVTTLPNGQILVTADGSPARAEVATTVQFANGQTGIIKVDGNPADAQGKITAAVQFADGSTGTIRVDGNNADAQGKVTASVTYANGQTGTIKINAVDAGAIAAANAIRATINAMQASIKVVSQPFGPIGNATGNVIPAGFARGGVHGAQAFASGGTADRLPGRPFRAGTAQVFPPKMLRYTGDRTVDDEFYIPDNDAPRSLGLLRELARRRGLALVPQRSLDGSGGSGQLSTFAYATAGRGQPAAIGTQIAAAVARLGADLRAALAASGGITQQQFDRLESAIKSARPITVLAQPGGEVETAQATQLALRK